MAKKKKKVSVGKAVKAAVKAGVKAKVKKSTVKTKPVVKLKPVTTRVKASPKIDIGTKDPKKAVKQFKKTIKKVSATAKKRGKAAGATRAHSQQFNQAVSVATAQTRVAARRRAGLKGPKLPTKAARQADAPAKQRAKKKKKIASRGFTKHRTKNR